MIHLAVLKYFHSTHFLKAILNVIINISKPNQIQEHTIEDETSVKETTHTVDIGVNSKLYNER